MNISKEDAEELVTIMADIARAVGDEAAHPSWFGHVDQAKEAAIVRLTNLPKYESKCS